MLGIIAENWLLIIAFFSIAILYASVGFGGGSSYLAILAFTTLAFTQIRATALLCNIVVVAGNVYLYQKEKQINWKKIAPLLLFSIPMAYVGGSLKISKEFFFILLGVSLFFAAVFLWLSKETSAKINSNSKTTFLINATYGGFVGFISGVVGIGGGIFLAPLLHLTRWNVPKKIAATASIFIFVNSIAGLLGQYGNSNFIIDWNLTVVLLITVFIGGQIGNRTSTVYFSALQLKKGTALLIAFVSIRILWKYLFL